MMRLKSLGPWGGNNFGAASPPQFKSPKSPTFDLLDNLDQEGADFEVTNNKDRELKRDLI